VVCQHGRPWLQHRVEQLAARIGVTPPTVQVRELGYRWGSCGRGVNVHWRTILLPPRYIDYILAHELVHLCEPRHNKRFWAALKGVMPDFAERKQWLAENGGRFWGPGWILAKVDPVEPDNHPAASNTSNTPRSSQVHRLWAWKLRSVCHRPGHAPGSLRLTSCTTQLLPSGSLKERNEP
jgi:hypothetical protein